MARNPRKLPAMDYNLFVDAILLPACICAFFALYLWLK